MRKTILIHVDGLTGHRFPELNNQTLLQSATIPNLDNLVRQGEAGRLGVPGEPRRFSGEMALLALLGYDSHKWYTGPGPFEGISFEVVLDHLDMAYLCHLVTLRGHDGWGDGKKLGPQLYMDDPFAGGLETEDARELVDAINEQMVSETIQFYMGHHHRHLMVWVGGSGKVICRNPQEALGQPVDTFLPTGDGSQIIRELMEASRLILSHHPVNKERLEAGLKPANCLWLWGPGKPVELPPLKDRWPVKGVVLSPEGAYLGVGMAAGLQAVKLETAGEGDSDWMQTLAKHSASALETHDLVCIHLPFYAWLLKEGKTVPPATLVEYLQRVDSHVIGSLHACISALGPHRMIVMGTPFPHVQEQEEPIQSPYVLVEEKKDRPEHPELLFTEEEMANRPLRDATKLIERFAMHK